MFELAGEMFMLLGEFKVYGKDYIEAQTDSDDYTVAIAIASPIFDEIVVH